MTYDENPRISLEIWINFQTHRWGSVVTCITCWLREVLLKYVKFLIFALNKWLNSLNIFINAILPMGTGEKEPCQEQVLSQCKIKLQSSIYNSPLFSCCLTQRQKANIHSEVGNKEFHWLVQDSSCFVNQQKQSFLWWGSILISDARITST